MPMVINLDAQAEVDTVKRRLTAEGLWVSALGDGERVQLLVEPHSRRVPAEVIRRVPGVASVSESASPHPRVDALPSVVDFGGLPVGPGERPVVIAGPCSIESEEQVVRLAERLARLGVHCLRGGAFKPRTSPYSFQGHGMEALAWMRKAADRFHLKMVTEAMSETHVAAVAEHADVIQLGSRNMQNFALLAAVGRTGKPILLKRGMSATVDEWLLAAEYCLLHGASSVVFCERGVRGFDHSTRNLVDIGAVAMLAHVHRLPVIVDPSHGAGRRDVIPPLARAALAAGAAGIMLEMHDRPEEALSDGPQALSPDELAALLAGVARPGPREVRRA